MAYRRMIATLLVVMISLGATMQIQDRIEGVRVERSEEELLFLPNDKLLNHFTAGMSSVIADLLWLRTIQYTVKEFHNQDRKFTWLNHMCHTVTRLDPYYTGAYAYGGMLMAAIGSDAKALEFLRKGVVNVPLSEEIPFEIAKIYLLNRFNDPNSTTMAAHYLRMVAERSDHPEFYLDWIHGLQRQHNPAGEALAIWEDVLRRSDNPFIREVAKSKLTDLRIRANVAQLQQALDAFQQHYGRAPARLDELDDAGLVTGLPSNPNEGVYYIDETGNVQNSLLLAHTIQAIRDYLHTEIQAFKIEHGRFPRSLDEWANSYGTVTPSHPEFGKAWRYDPVTGTVE